MKGTVHFMLLPYLEQSAVYANANNDCTKVGTTVIKGFVCPSDPTNANNLQVGSNRPGFASTDYIANAWVLQFGGVAVNTIQTGTSNTVLFAEKLKHCQNGSASNSPYIEPAWAFYYNTQSSYSWWDTPTFGLTEWAATTTVPGASGVTLQYTTTVGSGNTAGSGTPFQTATVPNACNYVIANSPHTGTMQVGMLDGSVRGVSNGVSASSWYYVCNPTVTVPPGSDW